jgi:hypothetical protein
MIANKHHSRKAREYHRKHSRTLFGQLEPANLPEYLKEHAKIMALMHAQCGITGEMQGINSKHSHFA